MWCGDVPRRPPQTDAVATPPQWTPEYLTAAIAELSARDPVLAKLMVATGPCSLVPDRRHLPLLVRIIISQQISMKAARSIAQRLRQILPGGRFTAAGLSRLSVEEIRAAGLTTARASYIKNLADAVAGRKLKIAALATASDAQVHATLTEIKGIGRWSVEMLMIFGLGRTDVFPEGDLGIRRAMGELYADGRTLTPAECTRMAERWRPHRTLATWYLWRHADLKTQATAGLGQYPV